MKEFLKNKAVQNGIFMMLFYPIVMLTIFMSGYSAIPKNVSELSIAIVNEDQQYGKEIASQIGEQMPFHVVVDDSLEHAQQQLEDRDVHLIMHIPKDFTEKLSDPSQQVQLDYFINQSNPATVTSTVQNVVTQINSKLSAQLQTQSIAGILQNMKMPEEQSQQLAEQVTNKIASNVVSTNTPPTGMHNQMAPMFLTMATYVGAMIYSMMSVGALNQLKGKLGKWKSFFALQGINAILSLILPLVGVSIYFAIQGYGAETFVKIWLTHALELFSAIGFTSIFCMLLGQAGMLLNMILLLSQTIANGAVMPQEMMPGYFKFISHISVMFYTVHLDMNLFFGGGKTYEFLAGLAIIGVSALVINAGIHHFKTAKKIAGEVEPSIQPFRL